VAEGILFAKLLREEGLDVGENIDEDLLHEYWITNSDLSVHKE
jgi:hypothetical protein